MPTNSRNSEYLNEKFTAIRRDLGAGFLDKQQAAKHAGLSARRLLELAQQGRIRKEYHFDRQTQRRIAVFRAEDLDRLKESKEAPTFPQRWDALPSATPGEGVISHRPSEGIAPPPAIRPWMTVAEAAAWSGLPESALIRLIESGKLPALDVGVRPGGRYRISLKELQELSGERITRQSE